MKKVEKLSILFSGAVVACGVLWPVAGVVADEMSKSVEFDTEVAEICGGEGVTGEVVLDAERKAGVCVESGTEANLIIKGEFSVNNGSAIRIGKGATVSLGGDGIITSVGRDAEIDNSGNLAISGSVLIRHGMPDAERSGYAIQNHGTMTIADGVTIQHNGSSASNSAILNGYYNYDSVNETNGYAEAYGEALPSLTISGGVFSSKNTIVKNGDGGDLVVNDGTFIGTYLLDNSNDTRTQTRVNGGDFELTMGLTHNANVANVSVTGGVYSVGTADLRNAVAQGGAEQVVHRRGDGRFILSAPVNLEADDVISLKPGETVQMSVDVANYDFSVADENVASIDASGIVTANNVGRTTVTVTTKLAGFNAEVEDYVPVARTVEVIVNQVISNDSVKSEDGAEAAVEFDEVLTVPNGAKASLDVEKLEKTELTTEVSELLDRVSDFKEVYDLNYIYDNGAVLPVSGKKMKIYLKLSDELMAQDFKYYQVMYVKDNGAIGEVLHAQVEQLGNGKKYLAFETTHLSMYAVRAANTPFTNGEASPEIPFSGAMQENVETGETNILPVAVAVVVIAGIGVVARKLLRR